MRMRLNEAAESDMNMRRHYRRVDYSCINSVDNFLDVYSQSWKQNCVVNVSLCPVSGVFTGGPAQLELLSIHW